jgi:polysaccharide biosynthesis protein PslE
MMSRPIERQPTPADLLKPVFRHKWSLTLWSGLVLCLATAALIALPRKYVSDAKLFLRLGHESVALDPTATTGAMVQVQQSRENEINSARDMLKSRSLLERVVEKVGAEAILNGPQKASATAAPNATSSVSKAVSSLVSTVGPALTLSNTSSREKAINVLSKSIGVTVAKSSSVIDIGCTAKEPKLAQQILQAFLDAYMEQHVAAHHTPGSLDFFSTQATHSKRELDTAVEELRDAKNELGLLSIPTEQQAVQTQLTNVEESLLTSKTSLAATEASSSSLRQSLEKLPETLTTEQTTGFPNVAADHMQQEFFKVLISVNELRAKLGESHPLTKIALEQSQKLQQVLDKQALDRTQKTVGINGSRQSLELDLRREEALAASVRAKVATLTGEYAGLQQRLKSLNRQEVRIKDLERQVTIAEAKYRSYADHLEQARIGDALESDGIANINVVQPPSLVEKPVSPKPLIVFGLAVVSIFAGFVSVVFREVYAHQMREADEDDGLYVRRSEYDARQSATATVSVATPRNNQA